MSIEVKKILKKHKIKPSRGLGQNFLVDRGVLSKIITTAELKPDDIVLEVGPGLGNLTLELAKRVKKVIAVEKDPKMVEILQETLKDYNNVEIINEDILKFEVLKLFKNLTPHQNKFGTGQELKIKNFKIVANIPYYLTSPLIRKFLELTETRPLLMVLMVQKEVAQRIAAQPPDMTRSASSGSSRASRGMNLLAVSVQFYATPKIISYVSKKCFWPSPKVDSAIIKITPKSPAEERPLSVSQRKDLCGLFFKIVKAGFSHPRKQLVNNLSKMLKLDKEMAKIWLLKNDIQPSQRAETLAINDWLNLTKSSKIE